MTIRVVKYILFFSLLLAFVLPNLQIFALTPEEEREALEKELKELE